MQNSPVITYPPDLPICARREEIVAALRKHQVLVIAGETGSGKTTQLPKMCLEAGLDRRGRIGCTQPRRMAAMSVSRRVAEELGVNWGREVGCKMRFNDDTSRQTRVKFMTDGILLAEIQSDPMLRAYSTLIIDEAHERSLNIDFLLGYLQSLLKRRPDLKLIITSATIDTEMFSKAFDDAPIIEVSGRLFPVEVRYVDPAHGSEEEDPEEPDDYIRAAVRATEDVLIESDSGDVLVFMPTERDIRETRDLLEEALGAGTEVLPLFGRLSAADQQRIFAPSGKRRVIVATNIAETSLTIPGIGAVVDTGLARLSRYNPRTRTKRLPVEAISQSSANQRAGRAGRLRAGLCVRLYAEDDFEKRPHFTQPEIQRANLAEVILRMKAFRLGDVETFPFLNPPSPTAIRAGYKLLQELGALIEAEGGAYELTPLGCELANLPLDPTLGRMLLQARTEGTLPEMLVIAAGLSVPDPRERPEDEKEAANAAHKVFAHPDSDFLTLLNLWRAAPEPDGSRNALRRFCKTNYLSLPRMREWRDIFRQLRETIGEEESGRRRGGSRVDARPAAVEPENKRKGQRKEDRGSESEEEKLYEAVHRSVLAGLLGQVAFREERNLYKASGNRVVTIFPGSNLYERNVKRPKGPPADKARQGAPKATPRQPGWIMSGEIVQTSQLFARTVARIDPQWVVELGGHLCKFSYTQPQWSAKAGRVLVWERALIYGLELSKRQVDYGRVNPVEATELFIRGALVAGEGRIQHRFFSKNNTLRERIENALTKVRSGRMHDLDEAFYRFYAERIQNVSSVHDLDRLLRSRVTAEPEFLCATEADLMDADDLVYDRQLFPDQVSVGNTVLPLVYAYNPGEEEDGVTVRVPLPLAERLTSGELHWMVPGLREEQTGALIRALPKSVRKELMPLEPKIREIVNELQPGNDDIRVALTTFIRSKYGVTIRVEDWKDLPDYLRPRVEVVDRKNRTVAAGRDLAAVQATMDASQVQSDAWGKAALRWEKPAVSNWSFGDLPESVVVEQIGNAPLLGYPGLALRHENGVGEVDVRLFRKRSEAEAATPAAVRRLAELALARDVAWLMKELRSLGRKPVTGNSKGVVSFGDALDDLSRKLQPPATRTGKDFIPISSLKACSNVPAQATKPQPAEDTRDKLAESACTHIIQHAFQLEPLYPLTQARFLAMLESARRELPLLARKVGEFTTQILDLRRTILASGKRYPGMEDDLQRLVSPDFLARTPHPQLAHLPRYLRAVQIRAERASVSPQAQTKDAEKARPLMPFLERKFQASIAAENQEAFRWLLEEFRVSLFAQELGTAQPVSVQRLNALAG